MATVTGIEYVTTEVTDLGQMARKIQVKALVRFNDNTKEWHYYGYPIPENPPVNDPPYFEHPEIRFPLCFINLPDGSDVIASGAVESAINLLNT